MAEVGIFSILFVMEDLVCRKKDTKKDLIRLMLKKKIKNRPTNFIFIFISLRWNHLFLYINENIDLTLKIKYSI